MSLTFEEYCEEFLDLHPTLLFDKALADARTGYTEYPEREAQEKSKEQDDVAADRRALAKAKESRKLAKFYGGKALTGSAKQKKWGEDIRHEVFSSEALTDEQKKKIATFSGRLNTAAFWINNRDKDPAAFDPDIIILGISRVNELYCKVYDRLARTGPAHEKECIRKGLYEAISSLPVEIKFDLILCGDFYNPWGQLKKELAFRC